MKIFNCPNCNVTVYFENSKCINCNYALGYNWYSDSFVIPQSFNSQSNNQLKFCKNFEHSVCNWLIPQSSQDLFCKACMLNRKVPNVADVDNYKKWQKLEIAKHRLIYQLIKLKLPIASKLTSDTGIAFDFLSANNKENKLTGHSDGVITILLSEADSVHREQLKAQMGECYRTLLGHFRHEIGHYYWLQLFDESNIIDFRNLFGDERQDYGVALDNYYKNGAPQNWNLNFISKYASAHSWEDWAETWAHYLHIMDTLETAHALGISFKCNPISSDVNARGFINPYLETDFKVIFDASIVLTSAGNSINRSMGLPDIYPFVIPSSVYEKLKFIHDVLQNRSYHLAN
ncbi:hypothetical protein SAMN05421824_1962 [Hyunsoonleella jejuensis]|uniref:Zinc-ribbon domain-containing protein n=1 Tax=Hyunsoonleella jejuensis TaxID=419940 RepID=A0A1H9GZA4_9FLAO|nr:putative zinc-binding metallopeptidase [Hyunsoonleella jejuensis]SEQ55409.1 hypothetical protein SAMN05421824_1962 [Hyunsoonleella jejuensis]